VKAGGSQTTKTNENRVIDAMSRTSICTKWYEVFEQLKITTGPRYSCGPEVVHYLCGLRGDLALRNLFSSFFLGRRTGGGAGLGISLARLMQVVMKS